MGIYYGIDGKAALPLDRKKEQPYQDRHFGTYPFTEYLSLEQYLEVLEKRDRFWKNHIRELYKIDPASGKELK